MKRTLLVVARDGYEVAFSVGEIHPDIGGAVVTASITNDAAAELKLEAGQPAYPVIKASDVTVAVDWAKAACPPSAPG